MRGRTKLLLAGGALAWLGSIGALNPQLWRATIERERERLPRQFREALDAGKREATRAEEALEREVNASFRPPAP